jgi:hypothetical protein
VNIMELVDLPKVDKSFPFCTKCVHKQQDNIYCLENVQINTLNIYLELKLNYDVCYTYESRLYFFPIIKLN